MHEHDDVPRVSLALALVPVIVLIVLLGSSVYLFRDGASSGPNQIALLVAAGAAQLIGRRLGWPKLADAMRDGIGLAMNACLILLMVGLLIGTWMLCGTAPSLIYYGLGLLDPSYFYPAACVICAIVALTIGSSWTTAGTVGIAMIGIAQVMGLSLPVTAGAVISGAYFGDKLSPLSDTTNLAPGIVGADLFEHIRQMMWTTVPSLVIALAAFTAISLGGDANAMPDSVVASTRAELAEEFRIGLVPLLPLAVLLVLAVRRVPAYPALAAGALAAVPVAWLYQQEVLVAFGDPTGELSVAAASIKGIWAAMANGYVASTGNVMLDSLLSRGGMSSMLNTVWLIISAMVFGASMERTGLLTRIVESLLFFVRGTASLIGTTLVTCIGANILAADQFMAIVLPGRMFRLEYMRRGFAPVTLSRTLEDGGTMTSALIPWNTCGAFMAATLGVPTFAYLPYAFLNLANPLVSFTYALFDVRLVRIDDVAAPAPAAVTTP